MRNSSIRFLLLIIAIAGPAFTQKDAKDGLPPPDLSGTWEYVGENPKGVTSRSLIVGQTAESITFKEIFESSTEPWQYQIVLFTDNRGEKNQLPGRNTDMVISVDSRTSWKKNKLVRVMSYTTPFQTTSGGGTIQHRDTETYGLSKDGSSLVIEVVASQDTPFSTFPMRNVYKRTYRKKT
jgi:hypothetical protein